MITLWFLFSQQFQRKDVEENSVASKNNIKHKKSTFVTFHQPATKTEHRSLINHFSQRGIFMSTAPPVEKVM
jgi:hypothetical protein